MSKIICEKKDIVAIADATRATLGTSDEMTLGEIAYNINGINDIYDEINSIKESKANLTLGIASDGLIYLFVDGTPQGTGIPQGTSGDVFGYIDENNVVVLEGDIPEGAYTFKFKMSDGTLLTIGEKVIDNSSIYSITSTLTNCTIDNLEKSISNGERYIATITANDGYELSSITVTMGGEDASSYVSGGVIDISSVTGDIVITAVAAEPQVIIPTNFAEPNTTNTTDISIWCNNARLGSDLTYRYNAGTVITNYFPCEIGDVVYVSGITFNTPTTMNNSFSFYDENKAKLTISEVQSFTSRNYIVMTTGDSGEIILDTSNLANFNNGTAIGTKFMRIVCNLTGSATDVVINIKRNGKWIGSIE